MSGVMQSRRWLPKWLVSTGFPRQFATLLTGSVAVQAIPLIVSPILTRLYVPEQFGTWTLYASLVLALGSIAGLRYEAAIMVPRDDVAASTLLRASMMLAIGSGVVISLVGGLFASEIASFLDMPQIEPWIYFAGLSTFLICATQILTQWFNRLQDYRGIAASRVSQALTTSPGQMLLGVCGSSPLGLIGGTILGQMVSAVFAWRRFRRKSRQVSARERAWPTLKRHWKMPILSVPSVLADAVRLNAINVLIGAAFGQAALGQYGLAWRTALVPAGLISGALGQLYFQRLASAPAGHLAKTVIRFAILSAVLGTIPFGFLAVAGEAMFALVFGGEWAQAGEIAAILSPWLFLTFVTSPLSTVFIVTGTQGRALAWAVAAAVVPFMTMAVGRVDLMTAVGALSWGMSLMCIVYLLVAFEASWRHDRRTR